MPRDRFDPWLIPPEPPAAQSPSLVQSPLTVSQLTSAIKQAISRALPATVHVVGQISNLKRHASGHLYLTLKDAHSELPCVMWRTDAAKLKFSPADGMEALASGGVEVFDRAGRYQLYIRRLEPRGVGSLELAFRQLYDRLGREGLFDKDRKKRVPLYPRAMAIVTSPTGAAIADMLRTIDRRFPCVRILLFPVRVQGPTAADEIASAIRAINAQAAQLGGIDVLIVGRGGGSLEDLWAFNEEIVARAIFRSAIPIITGIGHEVDTTIADLVADVRAATPTAAAQMAVPVLDDVVAHLASQQARLNRSLRSRHELCEAKLQSLTARPALCDPWIILRGRAQAVDEIAHALHRGVLRRAQAMRSRLDRCDPIVQRIAPHAMLSRMTSHLARGEKSLHILMLKQLELRSREVEAASRRLERSSPWARVAAGRDYIQRQPARLAQLIVRHVRDLATRIAAQETLLHAVSHKSVLSRGYSITRLKKEGKVIRSVQEAGGQRVIQTQVADGFFDSVTLGHASARSGGEGPPLP